MRNIKLYGSFVKGALLLVLLPLLLMAAWAQKTTSSQKQQPPAPGPIRPFNFPKYQTKKLANGLTVFVIEDHRQPLISLDLLVNAGGIATAADKAGLASLTAQLLRQGTETRSAQDIAKAIDLVGGRLSTGATDDVAQASAAVVKSSIELGFELLADIILHPTFKQEEIDRLMRQSLSSLQVQYADPEYLAPLTAARAIYGEHPYAYPVDGTPDTLRAITRNEIVRFHSQQYSPPGAFLAISGDITPEEALARVDKYFASWKQSQAPAVSVAAPPAPARKVLLVDKPDAVQTQIVVGKLGIKRNDPDYFPLLLGNQIFGGSFNSRLNMKLRAKEGLTYGARSRFETQREAGSFIATTFTRTEETAKTIGMLLDLLKEFRQNPATEAELKEAKAYLTGSFAITSETPEQVASRVLAASQYGLPADYWDRYRENILSVTPDQIAAAVNRHIDPEKVAIIAVGNTKEFAGSLESLGTAQKIPLSELDVSRPDLMRPKAALAAATPEAAARGMELIKVTVAAVGGIEALDAVKDSVAQGSMALVMPQGEFQAEVKSEIVYPDKIKLTMTLPFGQMIQAFDGSKAWMQQGPQTMELPPAMNNELLRSILLHSGIGVLREAMAGRAELQAMEPADVSGKKMDVLSWKQGENTIKLFLDPDTRLIAKASFRSVSPQGAADVDSLWLDYREISGLKIPTKVITYRNGQKFSELTLKEGQFNTGVNPAGFSKP